MFACDLAKRISLGQNKEQNLIQEKGIAGIARTNLVYRSRDANERVDQEYSCLEVNFQK